MNLLDIRTKFIELSGRGDLVVDETDYADSGANFFINAGNRWLDRLENVSKSPGKTYKRIEDGDWYTTFNDCRAVKKVYVADDEERVEVVKKELGWLLLKYPEAIDDIEQALYYHKKVLTLNPDNQELKDKIEELEK